MPEYIECETALQIIDNYAKTVSEDGLVVVNAIKDIINIICPTIDVVRCKDCKHYRNHPNGLCYAHTEPYGTGYKGETICVEPDDFCSYGERKDVQE